MKLIPLLLLLPLILWGCSQPVYIIQYPAVINSWHIECSHMWLNVNFNWCDRFERKSKTEFECLNQTKENKYMYTQANCVIID